MSDPRHGSPGSPAREDAGRHIWDDPSNVRRLLVAFFGVCGALLLADLLIHRHLSFEQGELPIEGWFGFYGLYGFVACVLLVLLAKQLRRVLMRDQDYYDR